ncbi:class I SAM-dependent methyltransferase [[Mycobacterium] crassicus]|uniref:Class I SAM-dependent methyltransferase n=1 Tax=[Mycobacterium] crassicus TaxID=2872309 RepID=A0ABU5XJT0_9MYCO|nr:class I SAM-dependent methyltransferase [Mycolicibacter sp. MYC098]MEB3022535.1 class I SAM-dependent methyltransferase [Mycolicibacter sp. MYC098]
MTGSADAERFEEIYRTDLTARGLPAATPWDIGGAQPAVRRLVALGAIRGAVLDPGTGPGHHAIHFAQNGCTATGVDVSETAIERAQDNARAAGVSVDFRVGDAKSLDGFTDRFDTVVDTAFYNTFGGEAQHHYLRALHRATRPGARLFMVEAADYNINGFFMPPAMSSEELRSGLPAGGWRIDYLGPTSYLVNVSAAGFAAQVEQNPAAPPRIQAIAQRLAVIEPLLDGQLVHAPFWEIHATRVD